VKQVLSLTAFWIHEPNVKSEFTPSYSNVIETDFQNIWNHLQVQQYAIVFLCGKSKGFDTCYSTSSEIDFLAVDHTLPKLMDNLIADAASRNPQSSTLGLKWLKHTRHCHPVRQWKGFLVPVLLFCQNVETDCLTRPSKNCSYCIRKDI